jgi:hypothetical protein
VLERANELLVPDIPKNMFVTCLYMLLDPQIGDLVFANAGHNLPVRCSTGSAEELRAWMLLVSSPMKYEEHATILAPARACCFTVMGWSKRTIQTAKCLKKPACWRC